MGHGRGSLDARRVRRPGVPAGRPMPRAGRPHLRRRARPLGADGGHNSAGQGTRSRPEFLVSPGRPPGPWRRPTRRERRRHHAQVAGSLGPGRPDRGATPGWQQSRSQADVGRGPFPDGKGPLTWCFSGSGGKIETATPANSGRYRSFRRRAPKTFLQPSSAVPTGQNQADPWCGDSGRSERADCDPSKMARARPIRTRSRHRIESPASGFRVEILEAYLTTSDQTASCVLRLDQPQLLRTAAV